VGTVLPTSPRSHPTSIVFLYARVTVHGGCHLIAASGPAESWVAHGFTRPASEGNPDGPPRALCRRCRPGGGWRRCHCPTHSGPGRRRLVAAGGPCVRCLGPRLGCAADAARAG